MDDPCRSAEDDGLLIPVDECITYLEHVRWQGTPVCPYCRRRTPSTACPKERRYHCNRCGATYSVTVDTIFHGTHVPLPKWFAAIALMLVSHKGPSTRELARRLKISKTTACRVITHIEHRMVDSPEDRELLRRIAEWIRTTTGS